MIRDSYNMFSDGVAPGAVGTNVIGDVIDTESLGGLAGSVSGARDFGLTEELYFVVQVATDILSGVGAGTLQLELVSASDAALTTAVQVHLTGASFATDTVTPIAAGTYLIRAELPINGAVYGRYMGMRAVVGGNNVASGTVRGELTNNPPAYHAYPQGNVAG